MANIHENISFGLVNIPVVMAPVIKNNDASFNQLHNKCLNRIKYIKYCPHCKKDVKEKDIIKGYEYEKDNYVIFDKKELELLHPEKTGEIEVVAFIKENEVPSYYFEKSYFLQTDSKSSAYSLFKEALKKTKKIALAKCILSSKFYYVILKLVDEGIIMTTLYFEEEINIKEDNNKKEVKPKELELAIKLIDNMSGKFEPKKYKDEYQDNIKKAINDKLSGKKIKGVRKKKTTNVTDLLDALEKSLK